MGVLAPEVERQLAAGVLGRLRVTATCQLRQQVAVTRAANTPRQLMRALASAGDRRCAGGLTLPCATGGVGQTSTLYCGSTRIDEIENVGWAAPGRFSILNSANFPPRRGQPPDRPARSQAATQPKR